MEEYPGSLKGAKPEEDPESYMKWATEKMPKFVAARLNHYALMKVEENRSLRIRLNRINQ